MSKKCKLASEWVVGSSQFPAPSSRLHRWILSIRHLWPKRPPCHERSRCVIVVCRLQGDPPFCRDTTCPWLLDFWRNYTGEIGVFAHELEILYTGLLQVSYSGALNSTNSTVVASQIRRVAIAEPLTLCNPENDRGFVKNVTTSTAKELSRSAKNREFSGLLRYFDWWTCTQHVLRCYIWQVRTLTVDNQNENDPINLIIQITVTPMPLLIHT